MTTPQDISTDDLISVEPSARPNYFNVVGYTAEGLEVTIVADRREDEAVIICAKVREVVATYPGFSL